MKITDTDPRFVTKTMHAYLDYPVAVSLIALPFMLGLGDANPPAKWLAVVTGVAAIVLTFFTDHKTGVIRIIPFSLHVAVDFVVGIVFVTAPFALGFTGLDAWYYWANGGALLLVLSLQRPEAAPAPIASA
jgi:MFS superfamily sulfate permease-like transporter